MIARTLLPLALLALPLSIESPQEPVDPFERFTLENGVRCAVWTIEGAETAAAFALVPHGLLDDTRARTQWSHLLEHGLIRATHPVGLADGELMLNGETTGSTLRLEVLGPAARLDEAFAILADWLDNREFSQEMLAREVAMIGQEIDTTSAGGHTGKWALAALGQVTRHGAEGVAVRGAPVAATPEALAAYADIHVRIGPELQIVVAGPVPAEKVRPSLARTIGALQVTETPPAANSVELPEPGAASVSWDLTGRHYLEWYPLPGTSPVDRVAHELLARLVTQAFFLSGDASLRGGAAIASVEEVLPGVRSLVVSVGEAGGALDEETLPGAVRGVLDGFAPDAEAWKSRAAMLPMLGAQLEEVPDLAALREHWVGRPGAHLIEANVALGLVSLERATGLTIPERAAVAAELEIDDIRALGKALSEEERRALTLRPGVR